MPAADNPIVAELWRDDAVESLHRGAWVLVDTTGRVIDAAGDPHQELFARSATKSIQALPFVETGAADVGSDPESAIAVAISSHNGEGIHIAAARAILASAGLDDTALRCGPQRPAGDATDEPSRIANNCSGKHAGFLAATVALGDDPAHYLETTSAVQQAVRSAMLSMTGLDESAIAIAIDGCSAPTYRLPLSALATGLARMTNAGIAGSGHAEACGRIVDAARRQPELVGGTAVPRFDTELLRATGGRLFSKGGAEGVQTVGVVGAGVGFAAKIDDGSTRSLYRLTLAVLQRAGHISDGELEALGSWHDPVRRNRDDLEVGHHRILI